MNEFQSKKLEQYVDLLLDWNEKINLIGKSTIDDIWQRHIMDSAQLINFFNKNEIKNAKYADFGSGAGLPGIVLSILGIKNITLIEKSRQKCNFLREAIKISTNNIKIINKNIFDIKELRFDIIVSRALANLSDLIEMTKPFINKNSKCIFLKGKRLQEELVEAKKKFEFEYEIFNSETSNEGAIVILTNILNKTI